MFYNGACIYSSLRSLYTSDIVCHFYIYWMLYPTMCYDVRYHDQFYFMFSSELKVLLHMHKYIHTNLLICFFLDVATRYVWYE